MALEGMASVLVTGASGVLGAALVAELGDDHSVTCLVHRTPVTSGCHRQIRGDLTKPRLGLGRRAYESVARRTDIVVHCAAETGFAARPGETNALNVWGTQRILALAEHAGARLYYVSTAFVDRVGQLGNGAGERGPAAYLASKRAAEQLVRRSRLPAVILRPSLVIGDSRSGRITRFQALHALAGALVKNKLPLLPLDARGQIDFLPQDRVAHAIATLVRTGERGGEYWLTAGAHALSVDRIVQVCLDIAARLGTGAHPPRLVRPEAVDRLIRPVFVAALPEHAQRRFDELLGMTALCRAARPFPTSLPAIARRCGCGCSAPADLEAALARSLEYWAGAKGLAAAPQVVS